MGDSNMKHMQWSHAALLAYILYCAPSNVGALHPAPTDDQVPEDLRFEIIDVNGDAKLSVDELFWRVFAAHALTARDTNHDGRVSAGEAFAYTQHAALWALKEHPSQQRQQRLTDGDFSFARLRDHMVEGQQQNDWHTPDMEGATSKSEAAHVMSTYDTDRDGSISVQEYKQWLHIEHIGRAEHRYQLETHTKTSMPRETGSMPTVRDGELLRDGL